MRGRRRLFTDLDLSLQAGSIVWLRGANGSGKTSLLRMLAGLSSPESGDISRRAPLAYLAHANALKDDLTLGEALAFHARLHDLDAVPRRVRDALERLGVADRHDAPVRTLSQGQRRRGALARLAFDDVPRAWLLDEPFDALDDDAIARTVALIEGNAARGGAVLLTSHQAVALAGLLSFELGAVS